MNEKSPPCLCQDPGEYLKLPLGAPSANVSLEVDDQGATSRCNVTFGQQEAYSLILHPSPAGIRCRLVSERETQKLDNQKKTTTKKTCMAD